MSTDNGNEPVTPILDSNMGLSIGLTKREYFAGLAPDNIPEWFVSSFIPPKSKVQELNQTPQQIDLAHQYRADNYDLSAEDFSMGTQAHLDQMKNLTLIDNELSNNIYFAWRTYYADNILKELAK